MNQCNVKDSPGACRNGRKDKEYYTPGPDTDGCYVNADGRANLCYLTAATRHKQFDAGNTHLKRPNESHGPMCPGPQPARQRRI